MGGKVYDRNQLIVDRNPTKQLAIELGKLQKLDPLQMIEHAVKFFVDFGFDAIERVIGVDIRLFLPALDALNPLTHLPQILGALQGIDLSSPGAVLAVIHAVVDGVVDGVLELVNTARENALSALSQLGSLLHNLASNPGAVLGPLGQNMITGLQGALSFVTSGLAGAQSFIQGVINTVWSALRGFPVIGGALPGLPDLEKAVVDNKANQQNFTISAIVSDYRNPSYVCRYPVADVSWPEYDINKMDVFGTTDAASAGTAHTHTASASNSLTASPGGRLIAAGTSRGVYITVANTGVRDAVMLYVWQATAGSLSGVTADVFREREDGSLYRIFTRDISSMISTSSTFVEFLLPELLVAQAGERYMVRIYNGSSIGLYSPAMIEVSGAQQQGFYYASSPLNSATEYTEAQANTAQANTSSINFAALACKNMPSTDRFFSDDANRSAIGGEWFRKSSTAALLDIYEDEFGYTGSADGSQSAFYIRPTNRDVSRVEANLYINPASTARLGVLLHCNRDMSQVVYLGVNGTSAKIYSGSHLALTERASLGLGGSGLWAAFYDAANDKYVALKDGVDVGLKWTGVGSAVKHGSDFRYGGQRIEKASTEAAGTIDNWSLRDWMIAVPALVIAPVMEATASMPVPSLSLTVNAPVMTATATMPVPTVQVPATVIAPVMEATAAMPTPNVSTFAPVLTQITTVGPYSYAIPAGAKYVDRVVIGAGKGGSNSTFGAAPGGSSGVFAWDTVELGTDFAAGDVITGSLGNPGGIGGSAGGASTATVNGNTLTGLGGTVNNPAGQTGQAVNSGNTNANKDLLYNGQTYEGGGATLGANGKSPGGGGPGGGGGFQNGFRAGDGGVWFYAYA